MKKKAKDITVSFFRTLFGKLIAELTFENKLKHFKVTNFENLPVQQKIEVGQKIIEDVFKEFYTKEKIENMKIIYLLQFSLNEASGRVEDMTKLDCEVTITSPKEITFLSLESYLINLNNVDNHKFVFEWSEMLEGHLCISMDTKTTLNFSKLFMERMAGMVSDNDEVDEMKISSINEFFNILLPVFSKVIGDSFKQSVFFTPTSFEDFKSKYYLNTEFMVPQKMIHTEINIKINNIDHKGEVFFFIKNAMGRFKELIDQAGIYNDPFEESPPKIVIKLTDDIRKDMDNFFKILHLPIDMIDDILKAIYKANFDNFEYHNYINFYQELINRYFTKSSKNKKECIKLNLAYVLRLNKD